METKDTDRRARGVERVDFSTLVEICGRDANTPAFEAEAIELSGRGMQVRTRFLPDSGAPLVLRFEHDGKEAVVEGEVAWRRQTEKGGEFGIKFTALDSNSVRVLREACGPTKETKQEAGARKAEPATAKASAPTPKGKGTAVRLHIEGLGTPMKARVFESRGSRMYVGSQLEFLKVGRALELEDVEGGDKRMAEIDAVTVAIDPRTQIPQLVVSLCYEHGEDTPEPSVVDGAGEDPQRPIAPKHHPRAERPAAPRDAAEAEAEADTDEDQDDASDDEDDEALFKGRFASWAANAGHAIRRTSARLASMTHGAADGLQHAAAAVTQRAERGGDAKRLRRTSKPHSHVAVSARGVERSALKDLPRAQRSVRSKETGAPRRPSGKVRALMMGAAVLVCVSGAYPLFFADEPPAPPSTVAALPPAALPPAASALPASPFPAPTALDTEAQLQAGQAPLSASVPLFGTQQLATLEPAPLSPPPSTAIDEIGMAKDQAFAQPVVPSLSKVSAAEEPGDGAPSEAAAGAEASPTPASGDSVWQVGKMHLPIVHRLRLDGEAATLQGSKTPSGFSVLIPGRKVMETGAAIAKRDDRIISVNVKNTPAGGQVTFRFRKDVPGYKVRVRGDYVEFFVNSPER